MVEAYRQAEQEGLDLGQMVTLEEDDKVRARASSPTILEGATFPLRDAIRLMIAYSDNTATNLVLDAVGIPSTAATMEELGLPNSKIHSKVYRRETSAFPERSAEFGSARPTPTR
ncbi:hypothetical protein ElP_07400 [Tautonia plasticadhaerens]|uniref:beta-lactamase n=2 Tax=Tautonia plasticadhaerens TaxID=2527974 RepID=A0A518GWC6_9BACT|nr:serine hydrolase [Tautonia plasticadhaerens]QDV32900.1 hypothetical protein ElP_07400 [Tautonia plasticadhaerens]